MCEIKFVHGQQTVNESDFCKQQGNMITFQCIIIPYVATLFVFFNFT